MKLLALTIACAVLAPLPAAAQTSAPSAPAAADIDPARVAMARAMLERMIPPEKRSALVEGIVRPMMANMRQSMEQSQEFKKLFAENPQARDRMLAFIDQETEHSLRIARESMPTLYDAMAIAYARQFTPEQLADIERFYASPTGRALLDKMPAVMSDPAVMTAQRAMMMKSLDGLQARARAMAEKLQADGGKPSSS
jgi:hypothetical protein